MKENFTLRTSLILGKENMEKLNKAHVLLIGVGVVGSFCAEALVRAGIGKLTIVDYALVEETDFN